LDESTSQGLMQFISLFSKLHENEKWGEISVRRSFFGPSSPFISPSLFIILRGYFVKEHAKCTTFFSCARESNDVSLFCFFSQGKSISEDSRQGGFL
jgi:hypothetical protein